ncbi:SGNH hydrolase domain-containing protein [Pseudoroseomonas wenyumeiae]
MRATTEGQVTLAEIGTGGEAVLLTGDSVVFHYGPRAQALLEAGQLRRRAIFAVGPSCAPMPGVLRGGAFAGCAALPQKAAALAAGQEIRDVVIGAFWQGYATGDAQVERGGTRLPAATPAGQDLLYANLEEQVAALIRAGHRVHLLLPVPTHPRFDPQGMVTRSWHGFRVDPGILQGVPVADLREGMADATRRLRAIAARTGAGLIDPLPDLCGPGPACSPSSGKASRNSPTTSTCARSSHGTM